MIDRMFILKDDNFRTYEDADHCYERLRCGDPCYKMWGLESYEITEDDLKHLMDGGVLWFEINGEYAMLLRVKCDRSKEKEK